MFQQINDELVIKCKVIPKASRTEIVGWEGEELKIRLKAVPEKGQANRELIHFLASFFHVSKSNIRLVQGKTSRHKKIAISGIELDAVKKILTR